MAGIVKYKGRVIFNVKVVNLLFAMFREVINDKICGFVKREEKVSGIEINKIVIIFINTFLNLITQI